MDEKKPTQTTEQGLQIPVRTREQIERDSAKIAQPVPKPKKKHRKRAENATDRERARKRSGEND